MRIFLFLAMLTASWFYVDRSLAVAEPAVGGPLLSPIAKCDLPQPSENAAMLFAGYYEGATVSSIRLGEGPQGDVTSVVNVVVRRGIKPVYVVVSGSRHSILSFSGWTRRIEQVVVATDSRWPNAVTGLPADRVIFVDRNACDSSIRLDDAYDLRHRDGLAPLSMVVKRPFPASMSAEEKSRQTSMYRMPDAIGGAYQPETLALSEFGVSAIEYRAHEYGSVPEWFKPAAAERFHPGGLAEVSANQLITPVHAEPYRVLPDRAGIGQLIREGRVERMGSDRFRIVKPIELPEGLAGSMQVTFELAPNVPYPTGDLAHSKIR